METRSERMKAPLQAVRKRRRAEPKAACPPGQSEASESPWQPGGGGEVLSALQGPQALLWPESAGPQDLHAPRFLRSCPWPPGTTLRAGPAPS